MNVAQMNMMNKMNILRQMNMMNQMKNMGQMNMMNNMNNMGQMNMMNNMGQMNMMNNMNNANNMNNMMNNMNKMNNMNNMMNNMNNMNQMNGMNQMNNMMNMNNMNGMNQMNNMMNMNNMNQITCPVKGINNKTYISDVQDSTFINSVLQVFTNLNCIIKDWYKMLAINKNQIMNNNNFSLTKEIYILLIAISMKQQPDSSNIILHFINKIKSMLNKNIDHDPINTFLNLIDLLHSENNAPINPNFDASVLDNQNLQNMCNMMYMCNLFKNYYQQTQNSIFSQNFFNVLKYEAKCPNCNSYYKYSLNKIIEFNVDEYRQFRDQAIPQRVCMNLNMDELFTCFTGGNTFQCNFCGNLNCQIYTSIYSSNKVLIIGLKRNNHTYHCDIDFEKKLDICKYLSPEIMNGMNNNLNTVYELKAVISSGGNQQYFSDININNMWFRFMNDQIKMLGNVKNDIHMFEPQLLIYEIEDNQMQQMQMQKLQQMQQFQQMQKMQQMQKLQQMQQMQQLQQMQNNIMLKRQMFMQQVLNGQK